jgi:hypothetical protein
MGDRDGSVSLRDGKSGQVVARIDHAVRGAVTAIHMLESSPSVIVGSSAGNVAEITFSPNEHRGSIAWQWVVPDGSAVVGLGGVASDDQRKIITASGDEWTATTCGGCAARDGYLIDRIVRRLHRCLPKLNLAPISDAARRTLHLAACRPPPEVSR